MKTFPDLFTCEHCDSVYRRTVLKQGDVARCACCSAILHRGTLPNIDRWLAFSIAAAAVFVIANVCPSVRVGFEGMYNESTIWQAVASLGRGPAAAIAVPAGIAVIAIPGLQIGLLVWLLSFARAGRRAPGFAAGIRFLTVMRPWSMVEVSMVSGLVTMVKLSGYLVVEPLAGVWALLVLMGFLTLVASRDVQSLWDMTEPSAGW
jgi:paraquat-inducible protein A